ncbi:MAG: RNA polymerase sigma factor [Pseudonocardiaceae bacterium]
MNSRRRTGTLAPPQQRAGLIDGSSDVELARKLRDADAVALAELYRRFGQPCYALAHRVCADDQVAEDVVHEAFLTLWRDPWRADTARGGFTTWLLTLVHRKAVEAARRRGPTRWHSATDPEPDAPTSEPGAGRAATARIAAGQVRAALDRLPGEQREVLAAAYFGGHTLPEIAASSSVPLGTVQSRLVAGVRRLRSLLTEQLGPDALIAEMRGWELSR